MRVIVVLAGPPGRARPRAATLPADLVAAAHGAVDAAVGSEHFRLVVDRASRRGATRVLVWTNEPGSGPGEEDLRGQLRLSTDPLEPLVAPVGGPLSQLGGHAARFDVDLDADRVSVHHGVARPDPVHLARHGQVHVVATRALVAHRIARAGRPLRVDPLAVTSLLQLGFVGAEHTPFEDVRPLGAGETLELRRGRLTRAHGVQVGATEEVLPTREVADEVAAGLIRTARQLPADREHRVALTGGKDSRLIVAAVLASGRRFHVFTHGRAEHPDVVRGRQLAALLGLEHDHVPLNTGSTPTGEVLEVDVAGRLARTLRATDGAVSAYENTSAAGVFREEVIEVGGHGGGLHRGGYAFAHPATAWGVSELLRKGFAPQQRLLTPELAAAWEDTLAPWRARGEHDPYGTLDELYLRERAGRWASLGRSAALLDGALVQPFLDDLAVRASARAMPGEKVDERLFTAVLDRLAPQLTDRPLVTRRWRWDETPPPHPTSLPRWRSREPWPVPRTRAGFDWRRGYGQPVHDALVAAIEEGGEAGLWEVVRRDQVAPLLADEPPRHWAVLWRLATAATLVSGRWLDPDPGGALVPVEVP